MVADPETILQPPLEVVDAQARTILKLYEYKLDGFHDRQLRTWLINGTLYVPVSFLKHDILHLLTSKNRDCVIQWQSGRVLVQTNTGSAQIVPGKRTVSLSGRTLTLSKPPILRNQRVWLSAPDFVYLAMHLWPPQKDKAIGYDGRDVRITVPKSPRDLKVEFAKLDGTVTLRLPK